ncbi:MAG: SHOCT domain-containing protein [Clostridia bacterium]|nr:SHOCT domain-containing protein [Clostridia bacterium]
MSTEPAEPETVETKPVETVVKCSVPTAKHPTAEDLHPCDEILKYKRLLDEGIITKEEFDTKKKQILDL